MHNITWQCYSKEVSSSNADRFNALIIDLPSSDMSEEERIQLSSMEKRKLKSGGYVLIFGIYETSL